MYARGQVTIANSSLPLDDLFFVVATMNPYDGVGTYTLPDAMLDRFLLSYELGYPSMSTEAKILENAVSHERVVALWSRKYPKMETILSGRHICRPKDFPIYCTTH